ncbi:MAG: aminotransferase class I/II-fold pyridoxal phosphate-dependent enzyme, partial [Methylococcaceae bacterium]|nr:aminotransferase class I/II-fold pyridoxal phosphate-dependent enzyme [Methylococcaceae bacterium]
EGLIVLRSFGKFFGCPGARLGFVAAEIGVLDALRELAGPWTLAGPSRWVGRLALIDSAWQDTARLQLAQASEDLADLLRQSGLPPTGGTPLFQWTKTDQAQAVYEHLLAHRILVRGFSEPCGLRFGLPGKGEDWQRLSLALEALPEGLAGFC